MTTMDLALNVRPLPGMTSNAALVCAALIRVDLDHPTTPGAGLVRATLSGLGATVGIRHEKTVKRGLLKLEQLGMIRLVSTTGGRAGHHTVAIWYTALRDPASAIPGHSDRLTRQIEVWERAGSDSYNDPLCDMPLETERLLVRRAQQGDREAAGTLLQLAWTLARSVARRHRDKGVPEGDLTVECIRHFHDKVLPRFDLSRGTRLGAFTRPAMDNHLTDVCVDQAPGVRVPRRSHDAYAQAAKHHAVAADEGKSLTVAELAQKMRISEASAGALMHGVPTQESLPDDYDAVEQTTEDHSEAILALRRAVAELPELERKVLCLRLGLDGEVQTVKDTAEALQIPDNRVRSIYEQAIAGLRKPALLERLRPMLGTT